MAVRTAGTHAVLMGDKAKARSLGAEYITDEVAEISTDNGEVTGVKLASGKALVAKNVLNRDSERIPRRLPRGGFNCAGPWAGQNCQNGWCGDSGRAGETASVGG